MADIVIHLRYNLETGKKDIYIDYTSDDDAMPIEHEQQHREFVGQLLGKGILTPDEMGEIKVNRVRPEAAPQQQPQQPIEPQKASNEQ